MPVRSPVQPIPGAGTLPATVVLAMALWQGRSRGRRQTADESDALSPGCPG